MHGPNLFLAFALKGVIVTIWASLRIVWKKKRDADRAAEAGIGAQEVSQGVEGFTPRPGYKLLNPARSTTRK